jgi:hypothetical protein
VGIEWFGGIKQDFFLFSTMPMQTGVYPTSYPMGAGAPFPLGLKGLGMMLTTHLPLVPRLRSHGSVCPVPPYVFMECCLGGRTAYSTLSPKMHLFKLGLTDDPICERFLEDNESATHILCDFEAVAYLRFCYLGQFIMEPSDYYDTPINKVLHFI